MLSAREKYWAGLVGRCAGALLAIYLLFLMFHYVLGMTFWEASVGAVIYAGCVVVTWNKDADREEDEPRPRRSWAEIWREIWDENRSGVIALGHLIAGLFAGKIALYFGFEPINAVMTAASVPVLLRLYVTRNWEAP